uniref:NADH-ubiquinone oxidoreductase chain 2 n=1 Tax=Tetramorium tsushimae TaxID=291737 RepID=A0A8F9S0H1_9HYME|nr:NADH dehydrogenase subunit 2 [Tetramorium tsushimae]
MIIMNYNIFSKYFISINLIMLSLLSMFFTDLMMLWFFMEIINFLFICLLNLSMNKKKLVFFYFLIQMLPSFLIIFSITLNNIIFMYNFTNLFIMTSIIMKLSIPPFHYWLPLMSISMPWYSLFLLLSTQKITPFYFLSLMDLNTKFLYIILIMCAYIPPLMMMKSNNLKILMSYSSINQSSWMILLIYMKNMIWFSYFIMYSLILSMMFMIMYMNKIYKSITYFFTPNLNMINILYILNIASMPPFSFFIMKWYSIFLTIMNSNMYIIMILMIISSLIMLYLYTLMLMKSMFFFSMNSKIIKFKFNNLMLNKIITMFLFNLLMSLFMIIL